MRIFVSYSRSDESWKDELIRMLDPVRREHGLAFDLWHDGRIAPGSQWWNDIDKALGEAQAALLIVSKEFIASDFCRNIEVARFIKAHADKKLPIIPVIVKDCLWKQEPLLAQFQFLPRGATPLEMFPNRDQGLASVAHGIIRMLLPGVIPDDRAPMGTPEEPDAFVDRPFMTQQIAEAMAPGQPISVALVGPGGTGKSVLAAHYVRSPLCRFDTIVWVDARGLGAIDIACRILMQLSGKELPAIQTLEGALQRLRLIFEHKHNEHQKTLVALDGLDGPDEEIPALLDDLTRAIGVRVLFTTRNRSLGARVPPTHIDVRIFNEPDAISYLRGLLQDDPRALDEEGLSEVVSSLGYLPQAIRIAGGHLYQDQQLSLADYESRLSDLLNEEAAFDVLRPALDDGDLAVFVGAGVCAAGGFSMTAVTQAADCHPDTAREAIGKLWQYSVIERLEDGRFALHPLLRRLARLEKGFEEAVNRHTTWVAATMGENERGWRATDAIRDELSAALQNTMEVSDRRPLITLCLRSLGYWFDRGPWLIAEQALQEAVRTAESFGGVGTRIELQIGLAKILSRQSKEEAALRVLNELDAQSLAPNWRHLVREAQAQAHIKQGDYKAARAILLALLDSTRIQGRFLATVLHLLASIEVGTGDSDAAKGYCQRAEAELERLGLPLYGSLLHMHAIACLDKRELGDALSLANRALESHAAWEIANQAHTLCLKGQIYTLMMEEKRAVDCFQQSLTICRDMGDWKWMADNLFGLAELRVNHHRGGARPLVEEAIRLWGSLKREKRLVEARELLARIESAENAASG